LATIGFKREFLNKASYYMMEELSKDEFLK